MGTKQFYVRDESTGSTFFVEDTQAALALPVVTGSGKSLLARDDADLATQVAALPSGTRYFFQVVSDGGALINLGGGVTP